MSVTVTFNYTGSANYPWPVPAGVTSIAATLKGAGGGFNGGAGGLAVATFPVQGGDTIYINVGGAGKGTSGQPGGLGGFNGGGYGSTSDTGGDYGGGGGGGASDIRMGGTTLADRKFVAGGGGGGGNSVSQGGGGGGTTGGTGGGTWPGTGGTQVGGGLGGNGFAGGNGSLGQGGNMTVHSLVHGAGGGGGGYYGGGTGSWGGGYANHSCGGGGSSFLATSVPRGSVTGASTTLSGGSAGSLGSAGDGANGQIVFVFDLPPNTPVFTTPASGTFPPFIGEGVLNFKALYADQVPDASNFSTMQAQYRVGFSGGYTALTPSAVSGPASGNGTVSFTISAGQITTYDTLLDFQIRFQDAEGAWSPWGSFVGGIYVAHAPTNPTSITVSSPVTSYPFIVKWSATYQDAYRIRIKDTTGTQILWDSGIIKSAARQGLAYPDFNNQNVQVAVGVYNGGQAGAETGVGPIVLAGYVKRSVASQIGVEAFIYDGITGAYICTLPKAYSPTFLDEVGGPGAGSITLLLNDPTLVANPDAINYRNIVKVRVEGQFIGSWIIRKHDLTVIATDEVSGEAITLSGPGLRIWFDEAILYPETGANLNLMLTPNPTKRSFGWMSSNTVGHWRSAQPYVAAVQQSQMSSTTPGYNPVGPVYGNPWTPGLPADWPTLLQSAYWIWDHDTRPSSTPNGPCYFFVQVIVTNVPSPETQTYRIWATGDNTLELYLDGQLLGTSTDWTKGIKSDPFYIKSTGSVHTISARVNQQGYAGVITNGSNPAGFLFAMTAEADPTGGITQQIVAVSSSQWKALALPAFAPSWTPGDILQTVCAEAAARGVTAFEMFTLGFDYLTDSYGNAWLTDGNQHTFDLFCKYSKIIDDLESTTVDVWFDVNGVLQCAPSRGVDRSYINDASQTYDAVVLADGPAHYWPMSQSSFTVVSYPTYGSTKTLPDSVGSLPLSLKDTVTGGHVVTGRAWTAHTTLDAPASALIGASIPYGTNDPNNGFGFAWPNTPGIFAVDISTGVVIPTAIPAGVNALCYEWWSSDSNSTPKAGLTAAVGLYDATGTPNGTINLFYQPNFTNTGIDDWVLSYLPAGGSGNVQTVLDRAAGANSWTHVVLQLAWVNGNGYVEFWLNNVRMIRMPIITDPAGFSSQSFFLYSDYTPNPPVTTNGNRKASSIAQYNRVLSAKEIRTHYQKGTGTFPTTTPVILSKAKNVVNAGSSSEFQAQTMLMAKSTNGFIENYASAEDTAAFGRIEAYYDAGNLDAITAGTVAQATIENQLETISSATVDTLGTYTPWDDFQVGDWILAPSNYDQDTLISRRVMSIALGEDEDTGRAVYTVELDTINQDDAQRFSKWLTRITPAGSLDGSISPAAG